MALEPHSWRLRGSIAEATIENRMKLRVENLERKLGEVVRLLRGRHHARPRERSPPRRKQHRVDMEDRRNRGTRRERGVQHSPTLHRESHNSWYHHREE